MNDKNSLKKVIKVLKKLQESSIRRKDSNSFHTLYGGFVRAYSMLWARILQRHRVLQIPQKRYRPNTQHVEAS